MSESLTHLKRSLNLPLIIFYGLGNILGAGIYVLIGKIAGTAGMYAPLAFVAACIVAAFTALSYAELAARYPVSAGEAVYVQEGFGRKNLSLLVGLMIAMSATVSSATIAHGFVGYLQVFAPVNSVIAITGLLLTLTAIAALGVKHAVGFAAVLTLLEIAGLLLVVYSGGDAVYDLPQRLPELVPDFSVATSMAIIGGGFLAFYAFLGFEDMVNVAEEVEQPQRNLPLGIVISLIVATIFYFTVALVAVLNVDPRELSASSAPLALVYEKSTGNNPLVITLISLFAVVNGALIQIIMISRILYGMSSQGWLPGIFSKIHHRTSTPVISTVFVGFVVWLAAVIFPLITLAKATSFFVLGVFIFVNVALIRIKLRAPEADTKGRFPIWVPFLGVITSAGLIAFEVFYSG